MATFAGLMPSPTKADFTEGLVIGYFSGVISNSIKDSVHRPMNHFCSAADTLQRFPPHQHKCSAEEYSILLIEQTSILYNFMATRFVTYHHFRIENKRRTIKGPFR